MPDGYYRLFPIELRKAEEWISAAQARLILGPDFKRSVYALQGEYLVFRKPLKGKVEYARASVLALRQAIQASPSFWDDHPARSVVRSTVEQEMYKMLESSLQR